MKIEAVRLRNFRAFQDLDLKDIPPFAVFVGAQWLGELEEPSARDLLRGVLPRLLPSHVCVRYIVFDGQQDLERSSAL